MSPKLRRGAIALAFLAALGLGAVACTSSSPSSAQSVTTMLKSNPALHQQLTGAEKQGVARLEGCVPNGKTMVGTVMAGSASLTNMIQVAQTFQGSNLPRIEARCHLTGHPLHQFDSCFKADAPGAVKAQIAAATRPYLAHPIKDSRIIFVSTNLATSQAAVRIASGCFAKVK